VTTLFVSDLHLDAAHPDAIAQFEQLLAGEARGAEALYILGDLFEAWVGDDDDDPARARACAALRALTASGVPAYVMHGNRDFLLGAGFEARTGTRLLADPAIVRIGGERVLLTHGDALCTADVAYQRLRAIVRQPRWQRRLLRLPLAVRRLLSGAARAGSRAHTGRVAGYIMDADPQAVRAALGAADATLLIHGHTHRPGIESIQLPGGAARRIVLGAWYEQGSLLRHDARGYELLTLPRAMPPAAPSGTGTTHPAP
jgi:UDP-2,3-diacylglucosamine hydrolase